MKFTPNSKPFISYFIAFSFLSLSVLSTNAYAQSSIKSGSDSSFTEQKDYPYIEVYSEIDLGNKDAGNDSWTDFNGRTVYGGKQDYRPHILRETYLLDEKQKSQLLQSTLAWLPYFGVQKENITLEKYFEAAANNDKISLYKLLPENLNQLYFKRETDENFQFYSTLLVYEKSYPRRFTVVWLDKNTWYIDEMYYRVEEGLENLEKNAQSDTLMKGNFEDFLRLSPIFQSKISEGFPDLKLRTERDALPLDKVVLGVSLSPGMPNTNSFDIQIAGDGSIMRQGIKTQNRIDPNKLTYLLLKAQEIDWERYFMDANPKPHEDDGQSLSVKAWKDGRAYSVSDIDLNLERDPLVVFVKMILVQLDNQK